MSERHFLFVYGLLRRELVGYQSLGMRERTRFIGTDRIKGRLYDLGEYPAAILSESGIVHGELFAFDDDSLLAALDDYELYEPQQPHASEYRRVETRLLDSGKRAWVYEYNRPIRGQSVIMDGIWRRD